MIARRDLMKAVAMLPVVAGLSATPMAWADSGKEADQAAPARPRVLLTDEVLNGALITAGSSYQDAAGKHLRGWCDLHRQHHRHDYRHVPLPL